MSNLLLLLSQNIILTETARYLSILDLFHLALTNSNFHGIVLHSSAVFKRLKSIASCDGRGLIARQNFKGLYALRPEDSDWGNGGKKPLYDEELEVRVWNLKCDAVYALPCLSCGINICEECRYSPRVRDTPHYRSYPRPHINPAFMCYNVLCYCDACDENIEADLPLSLTEYCGCDQYKRWICLVCKDNENKIYSLYYNKRTKVDYAWDRDLEDVLVSVWEKSTKRW
ncbi:hypothetical protein OCU04_004747 [Sclerotinia nivalis]|uniref:F-box domain-containing protein n=1 Tax=Sclerotinia nivalis TaxID=352851 RepID=A0A9X0DKY6_9HELO|nr:hypothetical protein OCU04_004747 [Sclerotinia nivalis]